MSPEKFPINPDWSVRELLRRSQTDVTPDHEQGLYYATVAYDLALSPEYHEQDPTAAGEAAAKAMFRGEQFGQPATEFVIWLNRSCDALQGGDYRHQREAIATHLLAGRGLALRCLKSGTFDPFIEEKSVKQFELAERLLDLTPQHGAWIPYATMLHAHHATFEAVRPNGSAKYAGKLALRGISSAVYSKFERANSDKSDILKHTKFVAKHVLMNTVALGLAATEPMDKFQNIDHQRHNLALKILG